MQIRDYSLCYCLPHPSVLLASPLSKEKFKSFVKSKIIDYWEGILRKEAIELKSLTYFDPHFMSLTSPHPIYRTAGYAPNKVSMAIVQALMLSGRYRCDSLVCKWSKKITGYCTLSPSCANILEDLDHILRICPALSATRNRLRDFTHCYSQSLPAPVRNVLLQYCNPENDDYCQFLLDSSGFAEVVLFRQDFGSEILESIFTVTRTWAYLLHRERLKLRGQWRSGPN